MHAIILAALAAVTTAMPSYIAVPAHQIAFVDLSDLSAMRVRRVPRQTLTPPPPQQLPQTIYQQEHHPAQFQQEHHPAQFQQEHRAAQFQQEHRPGQFQQEHHPGQFQQYQQRSNVPQAQPEQQRHIRPLSHPHDATSASSLGSASQYSERPPDFGEYVDFGAHTGDNGAFGWYADFPVNDHDDSNYRK